MTCASTCLYPRLDRAVRMAAAFLQEHRVTALPIDPPSLIRRCGWSLKKYSRIVTRSPHLSTLEELITELNSPDAATIFTGDRVTILYNDTVRVPERVRFSLCHEIGHLILEHFTDYDIDHLTPDDKAVLELEANVFAANLLAPPGAMMLLPAPAQEQHRHRFGMSRQSWQMRLRTLNADRACLPPDVLRQQQAQFRKCLCTPPKVRVTRVQACPPSLSFFPWTPADWSEFTFACMRDTCRTQKKHRYDTPALLADCMGENPMVMDD